MKVDRIVDYESGQAEALRQIFERTTTDCVHCHRVELAIFEETLGSKTESVVDERVFVSVRSGRPTGFSHDVIQDPEDVEGTRGAIRFLCYAPGDRESGLALIRHTVDFFRDSDVAHIRAFHQRERYPFYHRNHAYLSDRIGHVQALLSCEGFVKQGGEVHLDWDDYDPGVAYETEQSVQITWETEAGTGSLPALKARAQIGETFIGECHIVSCAEFNPDQEDRLFVNWLGVQDDHQGKGYGRFILQETMREAKRIGYRHAAISTAYNNHRAYAFYTNYGFRVTDWTYGWALSRSDGR